MALYLMNVTGGEAWRVDEDLGDDVVDEIEEVLKEWGKDDLLGEFGYGDSPTAHCEEHEENVEGCEDCFNAAYDEVVEAVEQWAKTEAQSVAVRLLAQIGKEPGSTAVEPTHVGDQHILFKLDLLRED